MKDKKQAKGRRTQGRKHGETLRRRREGREEKGGMGVCQGKVGEKRFANLASQNIAIATASVLKSQILNRNFCRKFRKTIAKKIAE